MGSMPQKATNELIESLRKQGAIIEPVKSGWFVKSHLNPNTLSIHRSTGRDGNARLKIRSMVHKMGYRFPGDPEPRPPRPPAKQVQQKEKEVVMPVAKVKPTGPADEVLPPDHPVPLRDLENVKFVIDKMDDLFTAQQVADQIHGITVQRVWRALVALGCERDGSLWAPPERVAIKVIQSPVVKSVPRPSSLDPHKRPLPPTRPAPEPAPAPVKPQVEIVKFVDPRNSWVIPTPAMLQKYAQEMGLNIEVRVWRGEEGK